MVSNLQPSSDLRQPAISQNVLEGIYPFGNGNKKDEGEVSQVFRGDLMQKTGQIQNPINIFPFHAETVINQKGSLSPNELIKLSAGQFSPIDARSIF